MPLEISLLLLVAVGIFMFLSAGISNVVSLVFDLVVGVALLTLIVFACNRFA